MECVNCETIKKSVRFFNFIVVQTLTHWLSEYIIQLAPFKSEIDGIDSNHKKTK